MEPKIKPKSGVASWLHTFIASALYEGDWSSLPPCCYTPSKWGSICITYGAGLFSDTLCMFRRRNNSLTRSGVEPRIVQPVPQSLYQVRRSWIVLRHPLHVSEKKQFIDTVGGRTPYRAASPSVAIPSTTFCLLVCAKYN